MYTEFYLFAGKCFKITHNYEYFTKLAREYVINEPTSKEVYEIEIKEEEVIDWKIKHPNEEGIDFPLFYLETLVIHSKVANILVNHKTFIFHGSSFYLDNENNAYIITAKSGTGKSTHTRLLKTMLNERIVYVNDDKPFLAEEDDGYKIYGSPWNGKERKGNNISAKLKGIFVLQRDTKCHVEKISPKVAVNHLIKQIHIPGGLEATIKGSEFIVKLCSNLPIYILGADMSEEAPKTSLSVMQKGE